MPKLEFKLRDLEFSLLNYIENEENELNGGNDESQDTGVAVGTGAATAKITKPFDLLDIESGYEKEFNIGLIQDLSEEIALQNLKNKKKGDICGSVVLCCLCYVCVGVCF